MNSNVKKLIAVAASALLLFAAYYGSYLPYAKSHAFITGSQRVGQAKTFGEFSKIVEDVLDMPSPVGQEELTRTITSNLIDVMRSLGQDKALTGAAVQLMEKYYSPILARGKGFSFAQHLYATGAAYEVAALQAKNSEYLGKAYEQFRRGLEVSPNRPQFLLGLFDVFRFSRETGKVKEIVERILTLWPWNTEVPQNMSRYLNSLPAGER